MIDMDQPKTAPEAETCVDLSALAIDGVAPGIGDSVEFKARGTVARIDGNKAYLTTTEVNGVPTMQETEQEDQSDDMAREEMMRAAMAADAG